MTKVWSWGVVLFASLVLDAPARGETASAAFSRGEALLKQSDFSGALNAFALAARANRQNQDYLQHYVMVRRVIELREKLQVERVAERWNYAAQALQAFYLDEALHDQAVALGKEIHARQKSADSACALAETLLTMGRNEEAAQILGTLDAEQTNPLTRALQGVAWARGGKIEEAQKIATELAGAELANPAEFLTMARLQAQINNPAGAIQFLQRSLESTAPSRQEAWKQQAMQCTEFTALVDTEPFAKALETESKVPESACSGGSSCAGCPMRGKCRGN